MKGWVLIFEWGPKSTGHFSDVRGSMNQDPNPCAAAVKQGWVRMPPLHQQGPTLCLQARQSFHCKPFALLSKW